MSLHHLGATRSRRGPDHLLQTPDTFVWAPLPGLVGGTACVHISPALGADFAQYTIAFDRGGCWKAQTATSRFVYVLEGAVACDLAGSQTLQRDEYLYLPPHSHVAFSASEGARVIVIEKPYVPLPPLSAPAVTNGNAINIAPAPLLGDAAIQVRALLPAEPCFDFAVNTMTYQPGARLGMVEVHVMEHGLLMLEGEGIYRLGDAWYPVAAGDFIWMAPYCPQWFGALGSAPARYLIYKDWNRAPYASQG